jgi:hypothetical protein
VSVLGAIACATCFVMLATGSANFEYYDTVGNPLTAAALITSAFLVVPLVAAAGVIRWKR